MILENSEHGIVLDNEFSCGSASGIRQVDSSLYEVDYLREEPPDWFVGYLEEHFGGRGVPKEYAFCIRIRNQKDEPQRVTVRFLLTKNCGVSYLAPPNWIRHESGWFWINPGETHYHPEREYLELSPEIGPRETIWLASAPFLAPEVVEQKIRQIAEHYPLWTSREIGRTAQNRPILVLESEPRPLKLAVAATLQPAEPAGWGVLHLAHWLTIPSSRVRRLLEKIQFCLIPMPNPDGSAEGRSVTNSLGEVPKFSFTEVAEGRPGPLETTALWNYLKEVRPEIYFEHHLHYTWEKPWVRRLNPTESDYVPEGMRPIAKATESALRELLPNINIVPIDPRKPDHTCYGVQHFVDLGILSFAYQGIPDSIENHSADVREVIEELANQWLQS